MWSLGCTFWVESCLTRSTIFLKRKEEFFSSIFWFLSILCVVTANKRVRNYSLETWVGCEKELPSKAGFSRWSSSLLTSDRNEEPDKSGMLRFWSGSGRALVGRVHGHQARSKGRSDAAGDCRARCWHVSLSHPADCHHQHKKIGMWIRNVFGNQTT